MKLLAATTFFASAATVSAQLSALPQCELQCGIAASNVTTCNYLDTNCNCQLANQALIAPVLEACLSSVCTSPAEITAAISAGEAICATVIQTAAALPTAPLYSNSSNSSMAIAPYTNTTTAAPTSSVGPTTIITTSTATPPVGQITDGQIQAPTSTAVSTVTSVVPYKGAAVGMNGQGYGGKVMLAAAGVVALAL